jgi:predicted nuclease with TOPRIM domain
MQLNESVQKQYARKIRGVISWETLLKDYEKTPREKLADVIAGSLLQANRNVSRQLLENYADASSRENFIKTVAIAVMSTPEYQLC